jgi:uncharacterized phage protein (TIGR02216 family)
MTARFPWARLMHLGLGQLKLSPEQFWRMTPRELSAALSAGTEALPRAALNGLMETYPDG